MSRFLHRCEPTRLRDRHRNHSVRHRRHSLKWGRHRHHTSKRLHHHHSIHHLHAWQLCSEDVWYCIFRPRVWHLIVLKTELWILDIDLELRLELVSNLDHLFLNFEAQALFDNLGRNALHSIDLNVDLVADGHRVRHFLQYGLVNRVEMSGQRSSGRKLAVAAAAGKVSIFLVLKQNVCVLKLLVAVVTERRKDFHASLLAPH